MISSEVAEGLYWYVFIAACVIGGLMFLKSCHMGLKNYGQYTFVAFVYLLFAVWFGSGSVVSGLCLGDVHKGEECEKRMNMFVYVYSIITSLIVCFMCIYVLPHYLLYYGDFYKLCFIVCKLVLLSWIACTGILLDKEVTECS